MNKARLLKLAALLEADAKNKKGIKFDIGYWGQTKKGVKPSVGCGTTGCAMGLAALSGAFKRHGLRAEFDDLGPNGIEISVAMPGARYGLSAAVILFEIQYYEADYLFTPDAYAGEYTTGAKGELAVAKRIRDFVAGTASP